MYSNGDAYEGEYRQGRMEGRGAYLLSDGSVELGRYKAGADFGEGVRWSPDRKTAYRLRSGKVTEEISLEEAARIAGALGAVPPPPHRTDLSPAAGAVAPPPRPLLGAIAEGGSGAGGVGGDEMGVAPAAVAGSESGPWDQ